jgi:hypothetical protein
MQEIAFSLPASCVIGETTISVTVDGTTSNTLPFTVRSGAIKHVKSSGNDTTGNGTWANPYKTLSTTLSGDGKANPGDIFYTQAGATADVNVGYTSGIVGTSENPVAVVAYPGAPVSLSGATVACFRNFNNASYYLVFSKFSMLTNYQAFSQFAGSRIIGNNITGPNINSGYSGLVGGNCIGIDIAQCGGHKILGNEVRNYGKPDGSVDQFQHLVYMSNKSGMQATGYEIGWNHFHDNPIYQGIHLYENGLCGGWKLIQIHHNVVKNQGGNSININFDCTSNSNPTRVDVYNNLTITDSGYNLSGLSAPASAIRIDTESDTVVNVVNNTFFNWGSTNVLSTSTSRFYGNAFVNNRNSGFFTASPTNYDNNAMYNSDYIVPPPSWAEVQTNPLLTGYTPSTGSPLISAGGANVLAYSTVDLAGIAYSDPADIGAFTHQSVTSPTCDASHLNMCFNSSACSTAGGYWYNNACNAAPLHEPPPDHGNLLRLGGAGLKVGDKPVLIQ